MLIYHQQAIGLHINKISWKFSNERSLDIVNKTQKQKQNKTTTTKQSKQTHIEAKQAYSTSEYGNIQGEY